MKEAVLQAYELVPDAYRQKFRTLRRKPDGHTYVEFARDKSALFEKWDVSSKVTTLAALKEVIMLEEFQRCLPEHLVFYLNEQKVTTLAAASLMADEYNLTHCVSHEVKVGEIKCFGGNNPRLCDKSKAKCFYCQKLSDIVKDC